MADGAGRLVQSMESVAGPTEEVVLTGGWARCAGLRRRKRQMFSRVKWPALAEAGRRGAALFGGVAAGVFEGPAAFPSRTSSRRTRPLPMQKIINDPNAFVDEMLEGVLLAHPEDLRRPRGTRVSSSVRTPTAGGKVGIVTGGGSGHLPVFLGYVGFGLADGVAVGNVFASPSSEQILEATREVHGDAGVLYLYGNYSGRRHELRFRR